MLQISQAQYNDIVDHCQKQYPKEACGLLAGEPSLVANASLQVREVYPMRNVEDSPIGYSMDPREQLQVERKMRQRGQRLIGIYHSHTSTAAYPSSVDVGLALSPDLSYVLVSLKDASHPEIKSYRIDGTAVLPEPLEIKN
ncbi:MAG: M67 family metallopeptidase [Candidatus Omnitrophica bacterium]|nr:M67 family metallopeptidase [Candidatus Omnitrophota bacterium]